MSVGFISATDVRANWSATMDEVIRTGPVYVKRTHDSFAMIGMDTLLSILADYKLHADLLPEDDGSVTLALKELDIATNAKTESEALDNLVSDVIEYADEFLADFALWSRAANRKSHIPYIIKASCMPSEELRKEFLVCRNGKN